MIHPLPERFGNETHVVLHRMGDELGVVNKTFEPDMAKYIYQPEGGGGIWSTPSSRKQSYSTSMSSYEPKYRPKRAAASSSGSTGKVAIPDVLHVETAIFVDRGNSLSLFM